MADREDVLAEADRAHALGLKGLYYSHDFSRHGYARNLDHDDFRPFWDRIAKWKFPAFVELSSTPNYDKPSYIANLMALDRLMQRYPATRFVLVMGPPVAHFAGSGKWDFPPEVLAAYRRDNLLIEIMFPITWGGVWEYPYPEAQELTRQMRDLFGASKLVWGSDMPNVERFCTYRQSVDYVRRHCAFLSASEKDAVLGNNAAQLFGLT
ncbi:MAG TPA: amidohydrolase family protein, partial [Xanthobacteraceae bacterium]|nr:amidohydrolase family protein [Xanthobacteraceae bacterium]